MSETPETAPASEDCATCLSGRTVALALVFAAFAAYCAADFATGGRLTSWVLVGLAAVRGRVPGISTTGGDDEH